MRLLLLLPLLRAANAASVPGAWTSTNLEGQREETMMMNEGQKGAVAERAAAGERRMKGMLMTSGSKEWQVRGLTRFPDASKNTTEWQFSLLDSESGQETPCSVAAPTSDPVASFYGVPCGDSASPFKISWGYNPTADSAVMTVCYTPNGTDAWFGYDRVSTHQLLGDSQKEPVYATGCA